MKKIIITFMLVLSVATLSGCGKKEENILNDTSYTFTDGNKVFKLGEVFATSTYGEPLNYSEVPSCAFAGIDKTYTYEHYEITTYPDGDVDRIYSVYFLDEEVKTDKGIKILDSLEDLTKAYGESYEKTDNLYTYTQDKTHLNFIVENDTIVSIEYTYDA